MIDFFDAASSVSFIIGVGCSKNRRTDLKVRPPWHESNVEAVAADLLLREVPRTVKSFSCFNDGRTWRSVLPGVMLMQSCNEKGDGANLCEAPSGPFRQISPVPFFPESRKAVQARPGANLRRTVCRIPPLR